MERAFSILFPDYINGEIRVYCETGRFVRPVIAVKNNVIQINILSRTVVGQIDVSYNLILPDGCYNTSQNISVFSSCLEQVINNILKMIM